MHRNLVLAFCLSCIAILLALAIMQVGFFKQLEYKTLDYRFGVRYGQQKAIDSRLFLIGIDDYDMQTLGHWPWPRTYHAILLEALALNPPQVVGFDILFTDPDTDHVEDDLQFVRTVRLLGNVVLAAFLRPEEEPDKAVLDKKNKNSDTAILENGFLPNIDKEKLLLKPMVDIRLPFQKLQDVAHSGFINAPKDPDGIIRRIPLLFQYKEKVYPSFTLKILMELFDIDTSGVTLGEGPEILLKKDGFKKIIPIDDYGQLCINFRGKFSDFSQINYRKILKSFWELGKGKQAAYDLRNTRNKIVLIGLTATGITDTGATSLSTNSPLVMLHLNALNSILQEDYVIQLSPVLTIVLLFIITFLIGIIAASVRPVGAALFSLLVITCYIFYSLVFFYSGTVVLPWVSVIFSGMFCFGGITIYRFLHEEREKKKIRKAFGNYLSHNVLDGILKDKKDIKLGGVRKHLTVLFLDIVGFTGFSERHAPEEVVHRLNEVFSELTEIIFHYDGTFDKYVGDELVAFWGAPEEQKDHARRAVFTAIEMVDRITEMKLIWKDSGQEEIAIGIGINSGEMLVGNMGSDRIMDYTVIGDEVNLAARIEGLSRKYDVQIIISDQTYALVKDIVEAVFIDEVMVKGRSKPAKIYGVTGKKSFQN